MLLKAYVKEHAFLTPLIFIGIYILSAALSISGPIFLEPTWSFFCTAS